MTEPTYHEILAALPRLEPDQLCNIQTVLSTVLGTKVASGIEPDDWLYDAMRRVVGSTVAYSVFMKTNAAAQWRRKSPSVLSFMETTFPGINRVLQNAVAQFLFEMLRDDLHSRQTPVTLGSMSINSDRIPAVFDLQFPGYRENGLASLILKRMHKGKA